MNVPCHVLHVLCTQPHASLLFQLCTCLQEVLSRIGRASPPVTWLEAVALASQIHDARLNSRGQDIHGFCMQTSPGEMTIDHGLRQGRGMYCLPSSSTLVNRMAWAGSYLICYFTRPKWMSNSECSHVLYLLCSLQDATPRTLCSVS